MDAGKILLKHGLLDERQLELARSAQIEGLRLDEAAVKLGLVTEEAALRALGAELGIEYVDLTGIDVDPALIREFPVKSIYREALFPISRQNGTLVVATSDPFNLYPLDELAASTGKAVVPVLANHAEIAKLIKTHLGVGSETVEGLLAQTDEEYGAPP